MSGEKDEKLLSCHPVWAWHPVRAEHEAGYTLFRKTVSISSPAHFHLALSADNRYSFYLDGKLLGRGPLRGDLDHYFYEEYEGELTAGEHIFAVEVVVWSEAWRWSAAPWAEMHAGGGFMAAGYAGNERMELPDGWLVSIDSGRQPIPSHKFTNPTGKVMPLKLRIGNFAWPGHRFDVDKITLNGNLYIKDQTFLKPEWDGG